MLKYSIWNCKFLQAQGAFSQPINLVKEEDWELYRQAGRAAKGYLRKHKHCWHVQAPRIKFKRRIAHNISKYYESSLHAFSAHTLMATPSKAPESHSLNVMFLDFVDFCDWARHYRIVPFLAQELSFFFYCCDCMPHTNICLHCSPVSELNLHLQ